jgi:hypothetical protein
MMETLGSSETPVLARATRRNIPKDGMCISRIELRPGTNRQRITKGYTIRDS